uniref:Uncharacterized protein n=1 Tax=viral metagenome TaxID=1070528 RepID=A0A6C0JKR5_9ZZZZ
MSYPQQIKAGREIVYTFETTPISYILLLAEMQSGKTGTFLFVICEMIRKGIVDYGAIFTGNSEIELKVQTKTSRDDFISTYIITEGIQDDAIIDKLKKNIDVVWGPDLGKFEQKGKTIYVWEESHFGQSKGQRVDKFNVEFSIDPTGNSVPEGCFVLSVSATPFSEFTSNILEKQHKKIVRMYPPESYRGIKQMREDNQIRIYSDTPEVQFKECLKINRNGYAIVRGMFSNLSKIALKAEWVVKEYIQTTKWKINDVLSVEPDRPTVIFIKGKLRMGKEINKTHLLWCMETSNNTKTDTLLQGLLGRCCGYDSRADILIFIRQKTVDVMVKGSNGKPIIKRIVKPNGVTVKCTYVVKPKVLKELKRFISWHDNTHPEMAFAPRRGTNMCEGSKYLDQIPLKVNFTSEGDDIDNEWATLHKTSNGVDSSRINHEELRRILKEKDKKGEIINKNKGTEDVIRGIIGNANPFKMRYQHNKAVNPSEGVKPMEKLIRAFEDSKPIKDLGKTIGVSLNEFSVFPNNREKCVYITFCLPNLVGCTTRREVFSKKPLQGFVRPPVAPFQLLDVHIELPTFVEDNFKRTYTTPTHCPDNEVREQALLSKHPYGLNISPWELPLDSVCCSGKPAYSSDLLTKILNKEVTKM